MKPLSGKKQRALVALVSGKTQQQAAQTAGVHENTLSRWMQEPEFRDALNTAGERIVATAGRRLLAAAEDAIRVVENIMNDQSETGATRLRAAGLILDKSHEFVQLHQVIDRLAGIESYLQELRENEYPN